MHTCIIKINWTEHTRNEKKSANKGKRNEGRILFNSDADCLHSPKLKLHYPAVQQWTIVHCCTAG